MRIRFFVLAAVTSIASLAHAEDADESKTFEIWSKKQDGLLRTVVRFEAPAKIAGTAFLLLQRKGAPDEQWIYLPAYEKARRITQKNARPRSSAATSPTLISNAA